MKRRVVITGLGVVTSLGCRVDEFWRRICASESGVGPITLFDTSNYYSFGRSEEILGAALKEFGADLAINTKDADWPDQVLKATGGKGKLKITYDFTIPEYGTDRMGRLNTKNGWIYEVAQWFPRMAAYCDTTGWQHKQYLGTGEFTLERFASEPFEKGWITDGPRRRWNRAFTFRTMPISNGDSASTPTTPSTRLAGSGTC